MKILVYPTRFANELRLGERVQHDLAKILAANVMLSDGDTAREYWIPTPAQAEELSAIAARPARDARSNLMFLEWREARLAENARRKALNEVSKTRIDLEVKTSRREATL